MDKSQLDVKKTIDSKLNLLGKLWGRLKAEDATSLIDEEIERVFCTVSLPKQCILHAKKFRDIGALYIENGELKYNEQILIDYCNNIIREGIKELKNSNLLDRFIEEYQEGVEPNQVKLALHTALSAIQKVFIDNKSKEEALGNILETYQNMGQVYINNEEFRNQIQDYVYTKIKMGKNNNS